MARVVSFADFIKFAKMFTKAIFKDSERVKIIRNYVLKCSLSLHFLIQKSYCFPVKKS